jgi:alanyl-tRNA synthetase
MVSPERLRFDFTAPKGLSNEQLEETEKLVNEAILANHSVDICELKLQDALDSGAVALFTEKYGDEVRVVTMGNSKELCGGTHVERTGDIGLFKITSESSISSGVRRIEALTGSYALEYLNNNLKVVKNISAKYKTPFDQLEQKVESIQAELDELKKTNSKMAEKILVEQILLSKESEKISFASLSAFISKIVIEEDQKIDMQSIAEKVQEKINGIVCIFLHNKQTNKVQIIIKSFPGIPVNLFDAGSLLKEITPILKGKGGGRADMAQGSGEDASMLPKAIEKATTYLKFTLGSSVC